MLWQAVKARWNKIGDWRRFVTTFLGVLIGVSVSLYLFVVLVDPYAMFSFSLPIVRRIVSSNERFMYPQIVRSKRFDSLVLGTSTSRLLDPQLLDRLFHVRFANLAMSDGKAWEQKTMLDLFLRTIGPPKVLLVGLDEVWCDQQADRRRVTFRGFPDWLYGEHPWRGFLYLFNYATVEIAFRLVGWHLGLYPERIRFDGYEDFVPPESQYNPVRAHNNIWGSKRPGPDGLPPRPKQIAPPLAASERSQLAFPALSWLDSGLAQLPSTTLKILAFMPVTVAAQPVPGTHSAAVENECKARVVAIGRKYGAFVIDWRIASSLTKNDRNYWDSLHYRRPIATRIVNDLAAVVLSGRQSSDGSYRILVR